MFRSLAAPGEWVTCKVIARRWKPNVSGKVLTEASKDVSRKLSNLERFGHISRRTRDDRTGYEYSWTPKQEREGTALVDPSAWLQPRRRSVVLDEE